jgi:hypothetical protein
VDITMPSTIVIPSTVPVTISTPVIIYHPFNVTLNTSNPCLNLGMGAQPSTWRTRNITLQFPVGTLSNTFSVQLPLGCQEGLVHFTASAGGIIAPGLRITFNSGNQVTLLRPGLVYIVIFFLLFLSIFLITPSQAM